MSAGSDARVERGFSRLARGQIARPWAFVLVAFGLAFGALPLMWQLEIDSDFQALLPESAASVRDLDEIRARFGGTSTLALAVQVVPGEGASIDDARAFVRELAPAVEAMHDRQVASVEWNVAPFERFVSERRHLYADLDDLVEIRDSLEARLEWERARANPFYIDLGDEEEPPNPQEVIARIEADADSARAEMERFPEGFYQHPEEDLLLLFVRTGIRGGETGATDRLIEAIERAADRVASQVATRRRSDGSDVGWQAGGLRIDYGGEIMDVREENDALREAVQRSTIVTLVLLFLSIYVFFMRFRAIPLLGLALIPPVFVTFGFAEIAVDFLNASSAFLGSIVVGNGVNPNIMWLGRYFEERRAGRDVAAAVEATHKSTWAGTISASLAAALAYGSLMATDHRGFRDFGIIGGLGMILCWVAAYSLLPAMVVLAERRWPMQMRASEKRLRGVYGVLFARAALSAPRAILVASVVVTVLLGAVVVERVLADPLEYDFRNLQADRSEQSRVAWVNSHVGETVEETRTGSALALLAPRRDDVPRLVAQLARVAEEDPTAMGAVRTIQDLMPADQDEKIPVLVDLRRLLLEVRPYLDDDDQARIDEQMPPERIVPVRSEDIPLAVARPFVERDGTRGRLIFVEHAEEESNYDGRYMIRWARAVRSAETEDGSRPAVAGTAVVFADLLSSLYADGPKAIGVAFLATVLLLVFTFRRARDRLVTLMALLIGVLWMAGIAGLMGAKLNFLNMVAFPITFGNGVDYAVNLMQRWLLERETEKDPKVAVRQAVEGAGGAVVLCSLTTVIGYVSLYVSSNRALNSFGLAMSLAEVTCVIAAVVVLPAALVVFDRKR